MPHYSYQSYDRNGARRSGAIAAVTREKALETLARRGEIAIEVNERDSAPQLSWWDRELFQSTSLPLPQLALFTRELTSFVKADLPIDESLRLVGLQPLMTKRLRQIVNSVLALVVEGESLSDALGAQGKAFPEIYWRLVRAGEVSGSLGEVLDDLANFLDRSVETRARVGSALLYPAVLVIAAVIAIGVIMTVLIPTIAPLFKDAGATPPLLMRLLGGLQEYLEQHWSVVLSAIGAFTFAVALAFQSKEFRWALDRSLLKLPLVGRLIERQETGRLARTLATLIKNGVPIIEAVRISGSVLSNRVLASAVRDAGEEIKGGGVLSAPLARSGLFSELFLRLTKVGETTGQLDAMLLQVAVIYEAALQRQIQRLTSLITPVVTLLIGGIIGGLILTVMSALISVNDLALK